MDAGAAAVESVSSLLLSPYLGGNGTDAGARDAAARLDASKLRRMLLLRPEMDVADVWSWRGRMSWLLARCAWLRSVQEFLQKSGDRKRARGFAEWMEFVRGVLLAANWPGDRALTAAEFETTKAWESVLDLLSTLDFSGRRVSFASAVEALELQAQKTMFAAPSTGAPVQVMGVAEAEGSAFDAVVFLHATDANWPAVERVHPLLPWTLQRALKMPGSDSALTVARSHGLTEDLLRSSGSVLFSYAEEDENGKLRPSPLLSELGIECVDAAELALSAETAEEVDRRDRLPMRVSFRSCRRMKWAEVRRC